MATATATSAGGVLNREQHYSLKLLAKQIPSGRECPNGDGSLHPATLTKWVRYGCKSVSGRVVKLEAVRLGKRWLVSMEAFLRFTAALADSNTDPAPAAPAPIGAAEAARQLEALGA